MKNNKLKYALASTAFIAVFIAAIVLVNIVVEVIDAKIPLKLDMTETRIYEISAETYEFLATINKPVTLYFIPDASNPQLETITTRLIEKYIAANPNLKLAEADFLASSAFLQKFEDIRDTLTYGSVIVEGEKRHRVVSASSIFNTQTGYLDFEASMNAALAAACAENDVKIAILSGHEENADLTPFKSALEKENFQIEALNLMAGDFSEDITMAIIASPRRDFAHEEIDKLDAFFDRGGSAQIYLPIAVSLPNLEAYLLEWGISVPNNFVVEQDLNKIAGDQMVIIPTIEPHDITNTLISRNLLLCVPYARSIEAKATPGVDTARLLTTSVKSFARSDFSIETAVMTESDVSGVQNIAMAAIKNINSSTSARLAVIGSGDMQNIPDGRGFANGDFIVNVTKWMQNEPTAIRSFVPKRLISEQVQFNELEKSIFGAIVMAIIPLILFTSGFVVWSRRKRL